MLEVRFGKRPVAEGLPRPGRPVLLGAIARLGYCRTCGAFVGTLSGEGVWTHPDGSIEAAPLTIDRCRKGHGPISVPFEHRPNI